MNPIYLDTHIHTSDDPNQINDNYDLDLLVTKIKEFNGNSEFLISITDHNTINKKTYLEAVSKGINIIIGVELHIKNYDNCPAYHCHIYFDLEEISEGVINDLSKKLDELYPNKVVEKKDPTIPTIQAIINKFDSYEFILLPHGGQSHATFDTSIPDGVKFDSTLEKSIYYNQFDGFTARGDAKLEKTQEYFKRLGINEFVNLVTCSDNYFPSQYPNGKDQNPFKPTWMLAKPTFNGLRLSLSEQSRLIYSNERPKLWSETIKSIKLSKPNIEINVELTFGLNVIIGGSSSGKTLLADSIYRNISKNEPNPDYIRYEPDKIKIENPSGMTPHYLSQNYIMSVINNVSEEKIENIDIIKRVFPGDEEIKEGINSGLRSFKKNIQDLVKCVKILEVETQNLKKIPIIPRLITSENIDTNIFEKFLPTENEENKLNFSRTDYQTYTSYLKEIEEFLSKYPFVAHNSKLSLELQKELDSAFKSYSKEKIVRTIVEKEKEKYDDFLRLNDSEAQTKKQNFDKLIESLRKYIKAYRSFFKSLNAISTYSINFDSEEIESMGHRLYIENDFILNADKFIEVVNHFIKSPITDLHTISPELFFESNFKKQKPKVANYDDFENKIYSKFEELNKKKYKIITNDGREFEKLSPGWKIR